MMASQDQDKILEEAYRTFGEIGKHLVAMLLESSPAGRTEQPEMLTPKQVARRLDKGVRAIYRMVETGAIEFEREHKSILIPEKEVERLKQQE